MLDFTSALYLGLRHPSGALRPWNQLTQGRPAALSEPPGAAAVAADLAAIQGCERAVLLPSTLHVFLDLFELLKDGELAIYMDAGSYPIARWGAERVAARGVPVQDFPHHDPDGLRRALLRSANRNRTPVVVTDGFCPVCGRSAPLAQYLDATRHFGGLLVIDDTQALGILGKEPSQAAPYGRGGGGSLHTAGLAGPDILVSASLAKGLGAPLAALAGSAVAIRRFSERSASRMHCSPPSAAAIHAAEHAIALNQTHGDALRFRLATRVQQFRSGLANMGITANGGLFPVQTLRHTPGLDALWLQQFLTQSDIRCVPLRPRNRGETQLGFLITARHRSEDIDRCLAALADALERRPRSHLSPRSWLHPAIQPIHAIRGGNKTAVREARPDAISQPDF